MMRTLLLAADWPVIVVYAALGLIFGSFLNVCIVRLPLGESPVAPRSRCPRCRNQIAWYDNIPVLSWVFLGAKCRHCKLPISVQYPLIELTVGMIWGLSGWMYSVSFKGLAGGLFGTIILGAAIMDARHERIPESYGVAGLAIGLVLGLFSGLDGLYAAVVGAVAGFGFLYGVESMGDHFFGTGASGNSYSRLMGIVGAFLGWPGALMVVLAGSAMTGVVSAILGLLRRRLVPFGIFLALAAGAIFVVGDAITQWYLNFLHTASFGS